MRGRSATWSVSRFWRHRDPICSDWDDATERANRPCFTLSNIKEDLEDIGPTFDGAANLEFRAATKALEPELVWLAHEHEPWRPRTM